MAILGRSYPIQVVTPAIWQVLPGSRLYLPSTGIAAVSPAFDSAWDGTTSASPVRGRIDPTDIDSPMATISVVDVSTADADVLLRQCVSPPLAGAQTIVAQAIRLVIRALETLATNNLFVAWSLRVVSNDGSTVRGTLVSLTRDDVEVDSSTLTSRGSQVTSSEVSALNGDRLALEIGLGGTPTTATHSGSLRIGDAGASDLLYDDVQTTDLNPYLQLAQALNFGAEVSVVTPIFGGDELRGRIFGGLVVR